MSHEFENCSFPPRLRPGSGQEKGYLFPDAMNITSADRDKTSLK